MNPFYKNLALWMVIGLVVVLLFNVFGGLQDKGTFEPNYSDFLRNVEVGRVESVTIRGNLVTGKLKDGGEFRTYVVDSPDFIKALRDKGVRISVKPLDQNPWYMSALISWFPMILFIGVWIFFMRQMQGGGAKALSFGKARARLISEKQQQGHLLRRGRGRRGQGRAPRDHRVPQEPPEVPEARRQDPQGRPPGRSPGHRQDAPGQGHRRRGERAVLLDLRLGLRRDVRGRGRLARPRPLRAGQEARALHHLHGRDRRGRPPPRRRARRGPRRARADAQPAPRRDGRLRDERGRDPDRGDEPARRARPGPPPAGALRPADRRAPARRQGSGGDPARPRPAHPARAGRRPEGPRPRHPWLLRRRPRQPRQRGGAARGALLQEARRDDRLREREGQGPDGRRSAGA